MESNYTSLMARRVKRILLVCNNYDSFALEEDGRIDVQIAQEYAELNLSNPPSITRAETTMEALRIIEERNSSQKLPFDLILTMYSVGELDVFDFAKEAKQRMPDCPIVLLSAFSKEIYHRIEQHDKSDIDYFSAKPKQPQPKRAAQAQPRSAGVRASSAAISRMESDSK